MLALGNPGPEYAATRHNAGFLAGEALAARWRLPKFKRIGPALVSDGDVAGEHVIVVKPQTYMNRSGIAVRPLLDRDDFDVARDLLVLVDEFALPIGTFRIRPRGSAGGHKGLKSIEAALRSREYPRLRIGVGPLPEGADWSDYVLAPFERGELDTLDATLPRIVECVDCWLHEGMEAAMNRFNRRGSESD